ncbi:MAG: dipeptidase [Alphaproteobacteria bacterium]|nr:dipeptidase [Alphaproteobacteria bacterium]
MTTTRKILLGLGALIVVAYAGLRLVAPPLVEGSMNRQVPHRPYTVPTDAQAVHNTLTVMDWHADTLLWQRDMLDRSDRGQVDLPRLQAGNFALQMFTTVTKTPRGQNYTANDASSDNITLLAVAQGWPMRTWGSLLERALYQGQRLDDYVANSGGALMWVRSRSELQALLAARAGAPDTKPIGALLGTEGAHPLEGNIENIDRLYDAGFRMVGLLHFFDNEIGGSLHGTSKAGLTDFGRAVVRRLNEKEMIIDLSHASEQVAWDVLAITNRPVVMSHTGLKGHCDTPRNFPDDLMKAIAARGGLIGIGFWKAAICDDTPDAIAEALLYGVSLVGADHIALGSDWDGAVQALTAEDVPAITAALLEKGADAQLISKIMGENSVRFLNKWLPKN